MSHNQPQSGFALYFNPELVRDEPIGLMGSWIESFKSNQYPVRMEINLRLSNSHNIQQILLRVKLQPVKMQ